MKPPLASSVPLGTQITDCLALGACNTLGLDSFLRLKKEQNGF